MCWILERIQGAAMNFNRRRMTRAAGGNRDTLRLGRGVGDHRGSGTQNIELGPKRKRSDVLSPVVGHDQNVVFAVTPGTRF